MQRTYRWLLIGIACVGLTSDLVSKYGVFRWLYNDGYGGEYNLIPGVFKILAQFDAQAPPCDCVFATWSGPTMPRVNHGALFGLGGEHTGLANKFFAVISVIAAIAILVWGMRRSTAIDAYLSVALGPILGGTIGNLYDRIVFGGVRDFLYFYYIEWPVFNIADCCLVVGAALLLIQAIFSPTTPKSNAA